MPYQIKIPLGNIYYLCLFRQEVFTQFLTLKYKDSHLCHHSQDFHIPKSQRIGKHLLKVGEIQFENSNILEKYQQIRKRQQNIQCLRLDQSIYKFGYNINRKSIMEYNQRTTISVKISHHSKYGLKQHSFSLNIEEGKSQKTKLRQSQMFLVEKNMKNKIQNIITIRSLHSNISHLPFRP